MKIVLLLFIIFFCGCEVTKTFHGEMSEFSKEHYSKPYGHPEAILD